MDVFENSKIPVGFMRVYVEGFHQDFPLDGTYLLHDVDGIDKVEMNPKTVLNLNNEEHKTLAA